MALRDFLEGEEISQDRLRILNPTPYDEEGIDMDAFRKSKLCDTPHVTTKVLETPFLFDIKFDGNGNGLIAGLGGVLLQSHDHGENWSYVESHSRQAFFAVGIGSKTLIAVGEKGLRRVSLDGGKTWKAPRTGFREQVGFMRDMVFGTSQRGWIVGANSGVLRTSDGGRSWDRITVAAARRLDQPQSVGE